MSEERRPTIAVEIDGLWWKLQDQCQWDEKQAVMIAPGGSKTAIPKVLLDEYVRLRQLEDK